METVYQSLQNHIKDAMISKNTTKRDILRCVVSEIKNKTINVGKEITDSICYDVVKKMIKQHYDSIQQFVDAGRMDLVEKENTELVYLKIFEPYVLNETETKVFVQNILKQNDILPIKKNMGQIMKYIKGNSCIDMKLASKIANDMLV